MNETPITRDYTIDGEHFVITLADDVEHDRLSTALAVWEERLLAATLLLDAADDALHMYDALRSSDDQAEQDVAMDNLRNAAAVLREAEAN